MEDTIWKKRISLKKLNEMVDSTLMRHLGIVFTKKGPDTLEATMPVDARTHQEFGILSGGANAALAETVASIAGYLCCEGEEQVVGVGIQANHLRAVRSGKVRAVCSPVKVGRTHQTWEIKIFTEQKKLCCLAHLTTYRIESAQRV